MVSLSLTFLHSPKLLILDEPTVGSDPVLGNCIWNYLHQCCKQNVSIIIVTHYIEEAAFGHFVGIMRNGTILEEGEPSTLNVKYGVNTLEEVFLHLCTVGDATTTTTTTTTKTNTIEANSTIASNSFRQNNNNTSIEKKNNFKDKSTFVRNLFLNTWILCVLIRKNLTRFFEFNISTLIFLIPAFQALILCTLYNRDAVPVGN